MKFNCNRKFVIFSALTLVWMAVIFLFSAQNGEESSGLSARLLEFLCGIFRCRPAGRAGRGPGDLQIKASRHRIQVHDLPRKEQAPAFF